MGSVRAVSAVFSPLDQELGLLPGNLTPQLQGHLSRLATYAPFRPAGRLLQQLLGVSVSEATVRRLTERAGAAALAVSEAEQRRLEAAAPPPPQGPAKLLLSTDGAMVPLVGGEWKEVKTLALGKLGDPVLNARGEQVVPCTELSYFSRLLPLEEFLPAAYPEIFRRGVETAGAVAGVNDGAEWCQTFVAFYRPDAVRILDFPHAGSRIAAVAKLAWGEEGEAALAWTHEQWRALKQEGPAGVLERLAALTEQCSDPEKAHEHREYLEKRRAQLAYPEFREAGWPLGSGCVESANKLVVEARLKGPGMHWAHRHVNPMLTLRNAECNERWSETWQALSQELRRSRRAPQSQEVPGKAGAATASFGPEPAARSVASQPAAAAVAEPTPPGAPKPARPHPWRQYNPGWYSRGSRPHARN